MIVVNGEIMTHILNIHDNVAEMLEKVQEVKEAQKVSQLLDALDHRLADIDKVLQIAEEILTAKNLLGEVCSVSYPKRRLSVRARSLAKLIAEYEKDAAAIAEANVFDRNGYEATFGEIKSALLKLWQKLLIPDKRSEQFITVNEGEPGQDGVFRELEENLSELESLRSDLPSSSADIRRAKKLKQSTTIICDKLEQQGYDQEIGQFLRSIRAEGGISILEVLDKPKLIEWLKQDNRAQTIRVVRNVDIF